MPVSKRNRVISLTQTKKKGLEHKQKLVSEIREAIEKYNSVYIFSVENMRNNKLKEVREEWKERARFIMGKNKVLQLALGRSAENEIADNIHKISERLLGQCGLLLTSIPEKDVVVWFENFREADFARAGFVATETVVLKEDDLAEFSHAMEPQFRRLGVPTKLVSGKIKVLSDYVVCTEGEVLSPEAADILKHKGIQMADFHVTLECVWKKDGTFKVLHEVQERSGTEVRNSKAKQSKRKRARKSINSEAPMDNGNNSEGSDQSDDDDENEDEEDDKMLLDEDRHDEFDKEALSKGGSGICQENRPMKKAVRKIKQPKTTENGSEQKAKPDTPPRRVTRSSVRNVK